MKNISQSLRKTSNVNRRSDGFTLIEFVITVAVMAVLIAIVGLNMPSINLFQTHGVANILRHDLRLTQILSMSQNARYQIAIGSTSYQIQDALGVAVSIPELSTSTVTFPSGVTITPATTIVFDSMGQPYDSSGVALTTALTLSVTMSLVNETVTVSPQTGFIQ